MPTTVLVDAWHLAGSSANRGIGTYLRGVLPHLAGRRTSSSSRSGRTESSSPPASGTGRCARRAPGRFAQREHELRLPFDVARAARTEHADVFFSPADDPPARLRIPWVQMLHDLIPLVVADPAFAGAAARWERIGRRLSSAGAVCTNSRRTADDAIRLLGLDPDRIHVTPLGVDGRYRPGAAPATDGPPIVLYVGEYGPHKGFAEAFAVADAIADAGLPHRLAMVGFLAPWYESTVQELLQQAAHPDRVDLLGYVDDVVAAYRQADALIVTSRYEGFCLPALEAMACGTPVVAFDNSALPEVVGDAGTLVRDGDIGAFASALIALLRDPRARQEGSEHGVERARSFTWDRCAAGLVDAFRSATDRPSV